MEPIKGQSRSSNNADELTATLNAAQQTVADFLRSRMREDGTLRRAMPPVEIDGHCPDDDHLEP